MSTKDPRQVNPISRSLRWEILSELSRWPSLNLSRMRRTAVKGAPNKNQVTGVLQTAGEHEVANCGCFTIHFS